MACLAPYFAPPLLFQLPPPYRSRPTPPRSSSPPVLIQLQPPYRTRPTPPRSSSPPPSPDPSNSSSSLSAAAQPYQPIQPRTIEVKWLPPPDGWIKLNFDGSVYNDGSGRASIGGVIRDFKGWVLVAFAERTEHASVGIVEARALIRGLRLALECSLGWTKMVVEGDDMVLVKLLRGDDMYTRIPQSMQDEILELLDRFAEVKVQHNFREANQVADALCHEAYHQPCRKWKGCVLPAAASWKLKDDLERVVHLRIRKDKV